VAIVLLVVVAGDLARRVAAGPADVERTVVVALEAGADDLSARQRDSVDHVVALGAARASRLEVVRLSNGRTAHGASRPEAGGTATHGLESGEVVDLNRQLAGTEGIGARAVDDEEVAAPAHYGIDGDRLRLEQHLVRDLHAAELGRGVSAGAL
jgi:hypothetical protein